MPLQFISTDEDATEKFGARVAAQAKPGWVIYLSGDLGAGKTTFTRGFLRALGIRGAVKSPTYTLVEPYQTAHFSVMHFDLYRLSTGAELESSGLREYFDGENVCLIEWPERGSGFLPQPQARISLLPIISDRNQRVIEYSGFELMP